MCSYKYWDLYRAILKNGHAGQLPRGPMSIGTPCLSMYVVTCCQYINKYYTILNYKYLLLQNAYLACVLLKIMNNINEQLCR